MHESQHLTPFASRLGDYIRTHDLTPRTLARMIDVQPPIIKQILAGSETNPPIYVVKRLEKYTGVDWESYLYLQPETPEQSGNASVPDASAQDTARSTPAPDIPIPPQTLRPQENRPAEHAADPGAGMQNIPTSKPIMQESSPIKAVQTEDQSSGQAELFSEGTPEANFAVNVKRLMAQKAVSATELGIMLNKPPSSIYRWLSGKFLPRAGNLSAIASLFDVSEEELIKAPVSYVAKPAETAPEPAPASGPVEKADIPALKDPAEALSGNGLQSLKGLLEKAVHQANTEVQTDSPAPPMISDTQDIGSLARSAFNERLRKRLNECGLTPESFAKRCGLEETVARHIITGQRLISKRIAERLAVFMQTPAKRLYAEATFPSSQLFEIEFTKREAAAILQELTEEYGGKKLKKEKAQPIPDSVVQELTFLRGKCSELTAANALLSNTLQAASVSSAEADKLKEDFANERESLLNRLHDAEEKLAASVEEVMQLRVERRDLLMKANGEAAASGDDDQSAAELETLRKKLAETEAKLEETESERETLGLRLDETFCQRERLGDECETLRNENAALAGANQKLEALVKKWESEAKAAQEKAAAVQTSSVPTQPQSRRGSVIRRAMPEQCGLSSETARLSTGIAELVCDGGELTTAVGDARGVFLYTVGERRGVLPFGTTLVVDGLGFGREVTADDDPEDGLYLVRLQRKPEVKYLRAADDGSGLEIADSDFSEEGAVKKVDAVWTAGRITATFDMKVI